MFTKIFIDGCIGHILQSTHFWHNKTNELLCLDPIRNSFKSMSVNEELGVARVKHKNMLDFT